MRIAPLAGLLAASVALAGCAGNREARNPVWVSGGINGLQQSKCHCGGVERKKDFKRRREAEARARAEMRERE